MYFATEKTVKQFRLIMDKWNDSYTEPLTSEGLLEVESRLPDYCLDCITTELPS